MLRELWREERGLTTAECAIVLAVLALVGISVWALLAGRVRGMRSPAPGG